MIQDIIVPENAAKKADLVFAKQAFVFGTFHEPSRIPKQEVDVMVCVCMYVCMHAFYALGVLLSVIGGPCKRFTRRC